MRKIIYGLILSLTAVSFVGCSGDNDPNADKFGNDPESGWVQFDIVATNVLAGAVTEFSVPVSLKAPVNTSGLTVEYTVTDIEGSSEGFEYSGSVAIPVNTLTGNIQFTVPETLTTNCTKFEITLTSASRSNVQIGLVDDVKPITHTVSVADRDSFLGTYDVIDDSYTVTAIAGEEPNELILQNLLDSGGQTTIFLDALVYFGFGENPLSTITYPNFADNYLFTTADGDLFLSDDFTGIGGAQEDKPSYFSPCEKTFDLNFFLTTGNANTPDINVQLVKM